jgi:hypothetical protein
VAQSRQGRSPCGYGTRQTVPQRRGRCRSRRQISARSLVMPQPGEACCGARGVDRVQTDHAFARSVVSLSVIGSSGASLGKGSSSLCKDSRISAEAISRHHACLIERLAMSRGLARHGTNGHSGPDQ